MNNKDPLMTNEKRNKLKICYIYQDQYPWDVRVEKFCDAFANDGIEVHIISRNRDGLPAFQELCKNIYLHRLANKKNKYLRNIFNFPAFFSPFWINKITNVIKEYLIDIVIVRDLPLSPAAVLAAKLKRKIVIMDMAENYPALIQSTWDFRGPKLVDYIIRNPLLLKWMEKLVLPLLDGIFVVSSQSAKRVEKLYPYSEKIWVIGNTPVLKEKSKDATINNLAKELKKESSFIFLYVGMIEAHRGIDIAIKAIPYLKEKIPDISFIVIGKGTYENKLKILAKELNVVNNVIFTGWISNENIDSLINVADVCLIPHYVTEHTDTTLPNKIFDYMAQKKPVLVTQSKSLSEIVESENCGLVYTDSSPESLADSILKLLDPKYRTELGHNGWVAVNKKYNWDYDKMNLIKTIRSIVLKN